MLLPMLMEMNFQKQLKLLMLKKLNSQVIPCIQLLIVHFLLVEMTT
jgi:hypothetical protein